MRRFRCRLLSEDKESKNSEAPAGFVTRVVTRYEDIYIGWIPPPPPPAFNDIYAGGQFPMLIVYTPPVWCFEATDGCYVVRVGRPNVFLVAVCLWLRAPFESRFDGG